MGIINNSDNYSDDVSGSMEASCARTRDLQVAVHQCTLLKGHSYLDWIGEDQKKEGSNIHRIIPNRFVASVSLPLQCAKTW